ncbi:MAG: tRNA pseudouridine(38-40) synthase TruA [Sulfurihydrogenibium sp.]|jgi:tRNA pseudouridine38-40 synthase|uniref:tRNA pseudouridine(38-40) synthase TruA n=2 Tax=Sulfurihydrogenibium sp. TaxID=2053621 RepID=UPI000CC18400|nr:MAG: tRNA pseudouridine(38-40) synthase TruA [Sulfurihydrogenibium sp.]
MEKKHNYKLVVAYIGTRYSGWQRQKNAVGIQQIIEDLLQKLFQEKITLIGSGRTDAGVHALNQVANFKTFSYREPSTIYSYLNAELPRDISVKSVEEVDLSFNARFSAKGKTYLYRIYTKPDPFLYGRGWFFDKKLDIVKMLEGIEVLKKYKDLSALAKEGNYQKKEVDLREIKLYYDGKILDIEITASHFLRNLVRRIVGHLVAIGRGSLTIEEFESIIQSKNPSKGKFLAPPEGLYLKEVYY